jgi:translocator protein
VDILLLGAEIAATMIYFYRVSRPAGLLMVPYILWVTLALALNFEIWRLNM